MYCQRKNLWRRSPACCVTARHCPLEAPTLIAQESDRWASRQQEPGSSRGNRWQHLTLDVKRLALFALAFIGQPSMSGLGKQIGWATN